MCVKVEGWSSFRGPGGRGYALDADPPLAWSAGDGTHILWRTAVPTHGMSSPVVWGKRLFLTGADSGQAWSGAVLCADVGQNGRQEDDDG